MPTGERAERKDWYKLDLSAIVYPTLQRRDFSSVYRLSVLLKEDIQPEVLQQAVDMAKQGQIAGVGIAHRGDTEYLKSIPDGSEGNNLGNLPTVPPAG